MNFKYFFCCIVSISNGSLNLIRFIVTHVIGIFCNSCPYRYAIVDGLKFIYFLIILPHIDDVQMGERSGERVEVESQRQLFGPNSDEKTTILNVEE